MDDGAVLRGNAFNSKSEERLLKLPSITTVIFVLTVLAMFLPHLVWSSSPLVELGAAMLLIPLLVGFRLFFSFPRRPMALYRMSRLDPAQDQAILARISNWSRQLGLHAPPTVLMSTTAPTQVFGTFRHRYLVLNTALVDEARKERTDDAQRADDAADWILVHELAHLKTGDYWKVDLTRHFVAVYLVVYVLQILLTALTTEELRYLAPGEAASEVADLLVLLVQIGLIIYSVVLLVRSRELYADIWAHKLVPHAELVDALSWQTTSANPSPWSLRVPAGLGIRNREAVLHRFNKSAIAGKLRSLNLQTLLLGGAVIASGTLLRGGSGGLAVIAFVATVVSLWLTILYSLPFALRNQAPKSVVLKACVVSSLLFSAGIAGYAVLHQFILGFVGAAMTGSLTRLVQPFVSGFEIMYLLLFWTVIMTFSTVVASPLVRRFDARFHQGKVSGWFLVYLWFSLSLTLFSILLVTLMGLGLSASSPADTNILFAMTISIMLTGTLGLIHLLLVVYLSRRPRTEPTT